MTNEIEFVRKTSAFMVKRPITYRVDAAEERIRYSNYLTSIKAEQPYRMLGFVHNCYAVDMAVNEVCHYFRVV